MCGGVDLVTRFEGGATVGHPPLALQTSLQVFQGVSVPAGKL